MASYIIDLAYIGIASVKEYLALHVLLCLIPAFFLAGAIASLFSKESVLKFFGADAPKYVSYSVAAVSGCLLAVCSCTVLPLFAGIYKRGAGIGPATTFLFSAPAINVLAIVYTAKILGYDLGIARAVIAILLSISIGLVMSFIYERKDIEKKGIKTFGDDKHAHTVWLFLLLLAILVTPEILTSWTPMLAVEIPLILVTIYVSLKWFDRDELESWMGETWFLVKQITPLLLLGVFFAGIIVELLPAEYVVKYVGGSTVTSYIIASVAAALMYFSTLTEVPIISALTVLGMGKGPALSMLLAGPALSLPNMIVINRIMGFKKGMTYIALVVVVAAVAGYAFGMYFI
ncbi:permease [uncultured Methanolobus sp.]|uniref:permease n=1 Tax=uncultured Methanolobus sp. TaxID=218300 RepID=UPI002AAB1A86|nr:permease [uncultured Methanolobus sp.]